MSRILKLLQILLLFFAISSKSNGKLFYEGSASVHPGGFLLLTNTDMRTYGQVFNSKAFSLKDSSFTIDIFFGIVPEHNNQGSYGMALVISPTRGLPGDSSDQYLRILNESNNGKSSNKGIAIELDIHKDEEYGDIDDNHVGINTNGLRSVASASAGYYDDQDGKFIKLSLISGELMRLSIRYSQPDKQLNVTLSPAEFIVPPKKPLLSWKCDLLLYMSEDMYIGFTASTGSIGALYYVWSWYDYESLKNLSIEHYVIPTLPPYPKKKSVNRTKTVLAVCLTLSVIAAFVAIWIGSVFYLRHKKVKEVLEEWEIQYGPHRFSYKELFKATKGFKQNQLLGRGGFGQVYKGTLAGSEAEIAVKRTSHDSRQGMNEFLAELSTIGRLRHPNVVRLLGYCKHKEDLYLVYDFMPNGSLDKYLYRNENQEKLIWEQRFKIIKDVASALLYLHQAHLEKVLVKKKTEEKLNLL